MNYGRGATFVPGALGKVMFKALPFSCRDHSGLRSLIVAFMVALIAAFQMAAKCCLATHFERDHDTRRCSLDIDAPCCCRLLRHSGGTHPPFPVWNDP